ncbi:MAG TPA: hypothetical protein VN649_01700 [Ramlibacter sp.]|nr:hypothetical protein [Ramlibacter sp.]
MPKWWARVLRGLLEADAPPAPAELTLLATAEEFLRPSLNDYHLPNQAALARSRVLLERALTPEQRRDLFARGYFYVKGRRFNYRIREGHSGNVDALDSRGCVIDRFCAHPLGRVPVYDVMLAQKLWIETDEAMFLRKAAPYPLHY